MSRILLCSTPRVGSVSYAEKLSKLLMLPLGFQPWEPYAFNKQPLSIQETTLKNLNSNNILVHSHIHACLDKINTFDTVIYIGRKNRIEQAWSFFVAVHLNKMQNIVAKDVIVPEPSEKLVSQFISWINTWDEASKGQHTIYFENLNLDNDKWSKCKYDNVSIENFKNIEARIQNECKFLLQDLVVTNE